MNLARRLRPARLIAPALLMTGIGNHQVYAQVESATAQPPALVRVAFAPETTTDAGPTGVRTPDRTLPPGIAQPPALPQTPGSGSVEGLTSRTPAGPKREDHVILPELKGLVLIDNLKELKPGGVQGSGVMPKNLPMLDDPAVQDRLKAFIGKPLTQGSVQDLGQVIVNWYREKKYPFVDVAVPAGQDVTNGVVQVVVTESRLGKIGARGNYWFSSDFLESQVRLQKGDRINIENLEEDKNWINQNPFRLVNIVASRGDQPGVTDLTVDTIIEKIPIRPYVGYSNSGVPNLGHDRWDIGFIWGNALWHDDQFSYQFTASDDFFHSREQYPGLPSDPEFTGHSVNYAIALPWRDKIIIYGYYIEAQPKLDAPFRGNFGENGTDGSAAIRYAMRLPSTRKFDEHLEFGYEFKTSNNNLVFGGPANSQVAPAPPVTTEIDQFLAEYDATERDDYGQTDVTDSLIWSPGGGITAQNTTALFKQQVGSGSPVAISSGYLYDHFVATRVTGLPLNSDLSKSLGWFGGVTAITKFVGQVSNGNLLPSEALGAGGAASVRGYDERVVNGSEGLLASQEFRTPTFSLAKMFANTDSPWNDQSQIGVFYDFGMVSNSSPIPNQPNSAELSSLGLGYHLIAGPDQNVRIDLDYGFQMHKVPGALDDSQFGHVSVTVAY
jgi:hemolysin activation/secretion protein